MNNKEREHRALPSSKRSCKSPPGAEWWVPVLALVRGTALSESALRSWTCSPSFPSAPKGRRLKGAGLNLRSTGDLTTFKSSVQQSDGEKKCGVIPFVELAYLIAFFVSQQSWVGVAGSSVVATCLAVPHGYAQQERGKVGQLVKVHLDGATKDGAQ